MAKKEAFLNPDCQPHGLTFPGLQMLGGSAQKGSYCMDGGNSIESCQQSNTRCSGPWPAHGRLDQDRQRKDSRSMHGIVALRRNSAVVTSLSCSPTRRRKPAWIVALSTFQQHHHVLMCLRHVMGPSCFPSFR